VLSLQCVQGRLVIVHWAVQLGHFSTARIGLIHKNTPKVGVCCLLLGGGALFRFGRALLPNHKNIRRQENLVTFGMEGIENGTSAMTTTTTKRT